MMRIIALLAVALAIAGCRSAPSSHGPRGPIPQYATLAETYNTRVAAIERLWGTTTVRVWYPNEEGEEEQAQVEGHLQYLRPTRFSLSFEKLGEVYGLLGCDDVRYWWIEAGKVKVAHIGEHAKADPARIRRLGVPVHPLDMVECLAITPLPAAGGSVAWSEDGQSLLATVPGRFGSRRLWVDPATNEPSKVELLDANGVVSVAAVLEKYDRIETPDHRGPRIATRFLVAAEHGRVRVRLTLGVMEMGGSRPKPKAFELDTLLKAYGIERVDNLDEPPGG